MARRTDEERLQEIEKKMEQMKAKKQQVETRLKEKERKQRTKRLIEVGAIFEKYFEIEGKEEAEKIALAYQSNILKKKNEILKKEIEEIKQLIGNQK
jgi:mannitol-specific phosphotransferase system IIBC component